MKAERPQEVIYKILIRPNDRFGFIKSNYKNTDFFLATIAKRKKTRSSRNFLQKQMI